MFQSIAGTEAANRSFGIDLALLDEAREAALALRRGTVGDNVMYFETGQGSALSADAHHGVDQQTLEARAYAVARAFKPLLVNTVVGFIGPEYLYDGKQITRAGLEDHFCGKLLGLPMGVDVCYTNHAEADQDDMDALLTLLVAAGVNFVMGVPGADDIMLGYQSTSFHDALAMRDLFGRRPAPEFEAWLERQGLIDAADRIRPRAVPSHFRALLPALSSMPTTHRLPTRAARSRRDRVGRPAPADRGAHRARPRPARRLPTGPLLDFQLAHARARDAVHEPLDEARLIADLAGSDCRSLHVASAAGTGSSYLMRPDLGRRLAAGRRGRAGARTPARYDVVFVVADGLSARAVQTPCAAAAGRRCCRRCAPKAGGSRRWSSSATAGSRSATRSPRCSAPTASRC